MKIRGMYILSLRSIRRMIAVFAAAFASLCISAATPVDMLTATRLSNAALSLKSLQLSLPANAAATAVPDPSYIEWKSLYLKAKRLKPAEVRTIPSEQAPRRYSTRKSLTVPLAARLTGLSESTIKRLDRDPRNTNYPGRNSTPEMLAAWARLYREGKFAAQTVLAANRPLLVSPRT